MAEPYERERVGDDPTGLWGVCRSYFAEWGGSVRRYTE